MGDYKPVKGDRVRVVYEGEAANIDDDGFTVADEVPVFFKDSGLVSIEKIEPPVEVFKPGDVVRRLGKPGVFVITDDGFVVVERSQGALCNPGETIQSGFPFTSALYERVDLG